MNDTKIIHAISIRQPYVEAILRGVKTIEYRSKPTNIRARVYLYASLSPGDPDWWRRIGKSPGDLPVGVIVGSVEITDCILGKESYEYQLRHPERLRMPLIPTNQPQPVFWRPEFGGAARVQKVAPSRTTKLPSSTTTPRRKHGHPDGDFHFGGAEYRVEDGKLIAVRIKGRQDENVRSFAALCEVLGIPVGSDSAARALSRKHRDA